MRLGLIGRKLGMTRIYDDNGIAIPVTAVQVGPCKVMGKRTEVKNGYSAVQLGFGEKREKLVNKPEMGLFKKLETAPVRVLKEYRVEAAELDKVELGQELTLDMFNEGQKIDIMGTSKGKGFAGVMKRHNMHGASRTHGAHEYMRHGGSIGCAEFPGRVWPGKKMAGQMGNAQVTTQNLTIVKVLKDENIVLVRGAVPGPNKGIVHVTPAIKVKTPRSK